MTPDEITVSIERAVSFTQTLRALGEDARGVEFDVVGALLAPDGARRLAAWMTPGGLFNPDMHELRVGEEPGPQVIEEYRRMLGANLQVFLETAATATGQDLWRVKNHVRWVARLSERELDRLLAGYDHLVIVTPICEALHLDYIDDWVLTDPARLTMRIVHSVWASSSAGLMRGLSEEQLHRVVDRFHKFANFEAEEPRPPEAHDPPRPGTRYRKLYEALAFDERRSPKYSLRDIDRLLRDGGGRPLPATARTNRSWWTRANLATAAQPQTSAWYAAGYRVQAINMSPAKKGEPTIESVEFASLPGRSTWLANEDRLRAGAYKLPEPAKVHINLVERRDEPPRRESSAATTAPETTMRGSFDPDVNWLRGMLRDEGEADRALIEKRVRADHRPEATDRWIDNLLTRARRQGVMTNHGTRSKPRWVETGSKGDLMLFIADQFSDEVIAPPVTPDTLVPEQFVRMTAHALGIEAPEGASSEQIARRIVEQAGMTWRPQDSIITTEWPVWLWSIRKAVLELKRT